MLSTAGGTLIAMVAFLKTKDVRSAHNKFPLSLNRTSFRANTNSGHCQASCVDKRCADMCIVAHYESCTFHEVYNVSHCDIEKAQSLCAVSNPLAYTQLSACSAMPPISVPFNEPLSVLHVL